MENNFTGARSTAKLLSNFGLLIILENPKQYETHT